MGLFSEHQQRKGKFYAHKCKNNTTNLHGAGIHPAVGDFATFLSTQSSTAIVCKLSVEIPFVKDLSISQAKLQQIHRRMICFVKCNEQLVVLVMRLALFRKNTQHDPPHTHKCYFRLDH